MLPKVRPVSGARLPQLGGGSVETPSRNWGLGRSRPVTPFPALWPIILHSGANEVQIQEQEGERR